MSHESERDFGVITLLFSVAPLSVINEDGEKVMTKIAHKQLHYMPLTPRMKQLFISKKTARHMRWHKEGVCENDQVIVHQSDTEAWKALDDFDADFAMDVRNVHIGLATDRFSRHTLVGVSFLFLTTFHRLFV
jgi:hypothetical protein